jgi:thiamine-phosphate pyrophosphorylase
MVFPRLNAIVDAEVAAQAGWSMADLAAAFLAGGVRFLQVRGKNLSGRELLESASAVVNRAHARRALVIVNDRADIAKLAGADGVHLGQQDLSPFDARTLLGSGSIIGRSTHTRDQLAAAAREGVDYVAVGPVFGTRTKATGYEAVGLPLVRCAAESGLPVVAIGGITLENAVSVIEAGAASVAVISDLLRTGDPAGRARAYSERLERI